MGGGKVTLCTQGPLVQLHRVDDVVLLALNVGQVVEAIRVLGLQFKRLFVAALRLLHQSAVLQRIRQVTVGIRKVRLNI